MLLALQLGRLKDNGELRPEQVSLGNLASLETVPLIQLPVTRRKLVRVRRTRYRPFG